MRITRDDWGLRLARVCALRSTCLRRAVGCVLVNADGHVLATGYNGVAKGQHHCNEPDPVGAIVRFSHSCPGALAPSGTMLDGCHAIHAEQNALLQCRDPQAIETCYVTTAPCMTCVKLLLNTTCRRIVFQETYAHPEAKELWVLAGRDWIRSG